LRRYDGAGINLSKSFGMVKETQEQRTFCNYLQAMKLLYMTDYFSFLSQHNRFGLQGMRVKDMPDIFIAEPCGVYKGMFIEMKREEPNKTIYKKNGELKAEYKDQFDMHEKLIQKGYFCSFAFGCVHAITITENYLKSK